MSKSDLLLSSLEKFYEIPENKELLHDILGKGDGPSLGKMFTVHVAYKSSLNGYSKKLFDPFCRTERIEFQGLTTTCGQLNFIRWVLSNGIVDALKVAEQTHTPLSI